jgi:hypothetical protein
MKGKSFFFFGSRKEWTHFTANTLRLTVQLTTLLRDHLNLALAQSGPWGPLRQLVSVPVYGLLASIRSLLSDQQTRLAIHHILVSPLV